MKYSEAQLGRVFVIRLEDGDIVHECIERCAAEQGIAAATVIMVGGADAGSRLVVGPETDRERPVHPMERALDHVHEAAGVGTLFPDEDGTPVLHVHAACGREDRCTTGCIRAGMKVWEVMEVVLVELVNTTASRRLDPALGFKLLSP